MKGFLITVAVCVVALSLIGSTTADFDIRKSCLGHFASPSEAAEILSRKDEFVQRLSDFDRAARVKTDKSVSEAEFLRFVKANVSSWTNAERTKVEEAVGEIRPSLEDLPLTLPKTISFVKTTGGEEGGAFYTRDTAIVFPESQLRVATSKQLRKTIAHELFHILSRENPVIREALYEAIGFQKCPEVNFPTQLQRRKITNPDAPRNDHSIRLRLDGMEIVAVPILFSSTEKYDVSRGGEFFNYLEFRFLVLQNGDSSRASDALTAPENVSGFFEQVGRNTDYVIHPEEILAENFALLVLNDQNVKSPEILQRIRAILLRH